MCVYIYIYIYIYIYMTFNMHRELILCGVLLYIYRPWLSCTFLPHWFCLCSFLTNTPSPSFPIVVLFELNVWLNQRTFYICKLKRFLNDTAVGPNNESSVWEKVTQFLWATSPQTAAISIQDAQWRGIDFINKGESRIFGMFNNKHCTLSMCRVHESKPEHCMESKDSLPY